jgi:hypothetical protein
MDELDEQRLTAMLANMSEIPQLEEQLKSNIKKQKPQLQELLNKISGEWGYEDGIYPWGQKSQPTL